jgi:Flp pilus assembly protein TadG
MNIVYSVASSDTLAAPRIAQRPDPVCARLVAAGLSPVTRVLANYAQDTRGAAALEFSLMVWPFLLLILGCVQVSVVYLMNGLIQTAAQQAGRMYMTGNTTGDTTQAKFSSAVCALLPAGLFDCSKLMVDVQTSGAASTLPETALNPTYTCANGVCTLNNSGWHYSGSTPQQYAIVRVMYDLPLAFSLGFSNQPNGSYLIVGTSVFQVEPYVQS